MAGFVLSFELLSSECMATAAGDTAACEVQGLPWLLGRSTPATVSHQALLHGSCYQSRGRVSLHLLMRAGPWRASSSPPACRPSWMGQSWCAA